MIIAAEAKRFVQQSEDNVTLHLDEIGLAIEKLARSGKTEISLTNVMVSVFPYPDSYKIFKPDFRAPEYSEFQKTIKKKLEHHGFRVIIDEYPTQTGGGLGSMDDEIIIGTGYQFLVTWK